MSDDDSLATQPTGALLEAPVTAKEKRRAARRRFLGRSAATGSGLAIVTLFHTRAFAQGQNLKSTIEACGSAGFPFVERNAQGVPVLYNSPTGQKVNCQATATTTGTTMGTGTTTGTAPAPLEWGGWKGGKSWNP
jgi:hypothetical protein